MFFLAFVVLGLIRPSFSLLSDKRGATIQWVDCASNVPTTLNGTAQLPSPLPTTLKCGRLDVPMDYSKPMSDDNTITLGLSMYRPNNSQGLINFNPGGPNAEVSSWAWQMALNTTTGAFFQGLLDFDFLAIDNRGTYSSNPVNCTFGEYLVPSAYPSDETEFLAYQAPISTIAQSCVSQSSPKGIMSFLSTNDTIQDWDRVRQTLGYDKMHLLGISYGTFQGAAYSAMFPQHAGRVVLDAVLPHGLNNTALIDYQTRATTRLLFRADAFCLNDTSCPFHSQGKGAVVQAFSNALNLSSINNGSNPSIADFRAMTSLAYFVANPNFPAFNRALFEANNGNWSGFNFTSFGALYTPAFLPVLPTLCLDQRLDNNTFEGFDQILQAAAQDDPYQIQFTQDLIWIGLCGGWIRNAKYSTPLPVNNSTMLVTADFDLTTPTEFSTFEFEQAPNSVLVVRHGDDHGSITVPGPASSAEIQFLATGILPNATNQTFISIYTPGSQRDPIADPYSVPVGAEAGDMSGTAPA